MPFVVGSYLISDDNALDAALAFDETCLANYDFGGTSAPDGVDTDDIGRLIGSQMVGMDADHAAELIRIGPAAPWHDVPIDARLEDAAPETPLFAATTALLDHFQSIKGVKAAKATKLLVMKRPALYPVIDSRVIELYKVAKAQHVGVSHPITAAIRVDLLCAATPVAVATLRRRLLADGQPMARRLAQLTAIRLRDIVLWQRWEIAGVPPDPAPWPQKIRW